MTHPQSAAAVELSERQLDDVQGGLLLPAVQKVREAAARMSAGTVVSNGGTLELLGA